MTQGICSLPIYVHCTSFAVLDLRLLFWQNIKAKGGIWLEGGKLITATHIIANSKTKVKQEFYMAENETSTIQGVNLCDVHIAQKTSVHEFGYLSMKDQLQKS